ncbi:hypothetical protein E2C01_063189 [Portunus trituberculatus]|uniref:Uncharacterized protein n=1 Tax=Portunus trituberculatus TaxID=210409 RepID=A0A5B7HGE0_PORTR|nr:hypothetical protein [Portunus trituberculatus]
MPPTPAPRTTPHSGRQDGVTAVRERASPEAAAAAAAEAAAAAADDVSDQLAHRHNTTRKNLHSSLTPHTYRAPRCK